MAPDIQEWTVKAWGHGRASSLYRLAMSTCSAFAGTKGTPGIFKLTSTPSLTAEATVFLSAAIVQGSVFWIPLLAYWVFRGSKSWKLQIAFVAACLYLTFAPIKAREWTRSAWLWKNWLEYFGWPGTKTMRVVGRTDLPGSPYLFCFLPHGLFPYAMAMAGVEPLWSTVFKKARVATANVVLRVMVVRHLTRIVSDAFPATRKAIGRELAAGKSVILSPGGIGEMFLAGAKDEAVLLNNRKGFIKLAIEHGVPLVPVYVFGNSRTFGTPSFTKQLEWISRALKIAIAVPVGRWLLPVPFKVPLMYAIGEPIEVAYNPNPSEEEVARVHQLFKDAVIALFEKYKQMYGWGDRRLQIH